MDRTHNRPVFFKTKYWELWAILKRIVDYHFELAMNNRKFNPIYTLNEHGSSLLTSVVICR